MRSPAAPMQTHSVASGTRARDFEKSIIRDPFKGGYQSLPVDWGINSVRKKGFFGLLAKVTGSAPP